MTTHLSDVIIKTSYRLTNPPKSTGVQQDNAQTKVKKKV